MKVQSVRFSKKKFTLQQAQAWLRRNGFKLTWRGKGVDETAGQYRFRQLDPNYPHKYVETWKKQSGVQYIRYF